MLRRARMNRLMASQFEVSFDWIEEKKTKLLLLLEMC